MRFLSKRVARVTVPVAATAAALALAGAPSAQADDPIPEFSFADCPPIPEGHQALGSTCFNAVVTSGQLKIGQLDQQFTEPAVRLTWASFRNVEPRQRPTIRFGRLRGEKLEVQPGIFARPEFAGVFAVPVSATFDITLGIKIRVINPALGPNCTIGGNDDPIVLNLTTGTTNPPPPNTPITGAPATIVESSPTLTIRKATHVDNAFAVPGARGCGLEPPGSLDAVVNAVAGVPSAAGNNTAIQNEFIGSTPYTELVS